MIYYNYVAKLERYVGNGVMNNSELFSKKSFNWAGDDFFGKND